MIPVRKSSRCAGRSACSGKPSHICADRSDRASARAGYIVPCVSRTRNGT